MACLPRGRFAGVRGLRALPLVIALVLGVGLTAPASATTVVALDDASLAQRASLVVVATVAAVDASAHDVPPGVFTDVTLVVERVVGLDVEVPDDLVVRMPGGRIDDRAIHVPGMPGFVVGETVLVFLEPQPDVFDDSQTWIPVGLEQGVWRPVGVGMWQRTTGDVHHVGAVTPSPEPLDLAAIESMVNAVEAP